MKLAKDISIAAFAVAISVATIAKPTQAALVNYGFTVNATSGDNPGQYFGSFQYDDSTLTSIGEETLGVSNGLSIAFDYLDTQSEVLNVKKNPIKIAQNMVVLG
ncbi:hypothetical protein [Nostoc sp. TCL240-02]|uniref:hypothetical protein n=1 Tax=Nostoc sp. TCL240-02 TaxID=2572090 RepID=UPI0034A0A075